MRKRYSITLTQENMEGMQALVKEFGQKPEMVGTILDEFMKEFLESVAPLIRKAQERGKVTVADLFSVIGAQFEKMEQLPDACPDCGRPMHKFHNCTLNPTAEGRKDEKPTPKAKTVVERSTRKK